VSISISDDEARSVIYMIGAANSEGQAFEADRALEGRLRRQLGYLPTDYVVPSDQYMQPYEGCIN
jgi:hypothetical protein